MANSINDAVVALTNQVAATEAGEASAVVLVQGIPALIQAAVDAAQNLPELQANLTALQGRLAQSAATLGTAVAAAPTVASVTGTGTGTTAPPAGDGSGQA